MHRIGQRVANVGYYFAQSFGPLKSMNYYPCNFSGLSSYSPNTGMVRMLLSMNT